MKINKVSYRCDCGCKHIIDSYNHMVEVGGCCSSAIRIYDKRLGELHFANIGDSPRELHFMDIGHLYKFLGDKFNDALDNIETNENEKTFGESDRMKPT